MFKTHIENLVAMLTGIRDPGFFSGCTKALALYIVLGR